MPEDTDRLAVPGSAGWTRRQFLRASGTGVAGLGLAGLVAACGGSSSPAVKTVAAVGKPRRGGTLRFGANGGANTDTLDGQQPLTNADNARLAMLYDQLVRLDNAGHPQLVMAESITPNRTATEWTIKIHPGITTHRGKSFTAEDVLYSFKRMYAVKSPGAAAIGNVDLASSKVVNPTTVLIRYKRPYALLVEGLTNYACTMLPIGYDPKKPDGTGPFKFVSFTPGVQSTFVRNDNYWQSGLPYLDEIITTDISDETGQLNGLQSGQLDLINFLSASSIAVLKSGGLKAIVSKTGSFGPYTLRVDEGPFSDVRVRQALRLVPDRQQMLNQLFDGYGLIGNDVFGITDPKYPKDLPQRTQDLGQAKSLLKAAGHSDLTITLVTTPSAPAQVNAAAVYATQAKGAGVNVRILNQNTTEFFAQSYLKTAFSQDYDPTNPYLIGVNQWTLGTRAPYNPTHFNDPHYNALYDQAVSTTDPAKQTQIIHEMAHIDYDTGGFLIPYFFPTIDGCVQKLQGVEQSETGLSPGGMYFKNFWFSG